MGEAQMYPQPFTAFVLDDNFYNRHIFRISLESVNCTVTDCADSTEAMTLLEKQTFDLLILDLQMPQLNGETVLKNVRRMPIHKEMRVVVVTANAHMATDGVELEADYLLYKPINVVEFARLVERLKLAPRLSPKPQQANLQG